MGGLGLGPRKMINLHIWQSISPAISHTNILNNRKISLPATLHLQMDPPLWLQSRWQEASVRAMRRQQTAALVYEREQIGGRSGRLLRYCITARSMTVRDWLNFPITFIWTSIGDRAINQFQMAATIDSDEADGVTLTFASTLVTWRSYGSATAVLRSRNHSSQVLQQPRSINQTRPPYFARVRTPDISMQPINSQLDCYN